MRMSDWSSDVCSSDLMRLVEFMTPIELSTRKRGPHPKSSLVDSLICYLMLFVLTCDIPTLAKVLQISVNRFNSNIERVRPILNMALKMRPDRLLTRRSEERRVGKEYVSTCSSR